MRFASSSRIVALCICMWCAACGEAPEPTGPGSVSVDWRVLPLGCADAGIDAVRVELSNEAHGTISSSFDCESSQGTVGDIPAGRYFLKVVGVDVQGHSTFTAPPRADVLIRADSAEVIDDVMELSAAPGKLSAEWRFHDGKVCGAHDVTQIRVALFDSLDSFVTESTFSCDDGGGTLAEVPAGSYSIWARAEGPDGAFSGVTMTGVKRGGTSMTELVLAPTD